MRCCLFLLLAPLGLFAQPAPPSFCFVLAEDHAVVRPFGNEVRVIHHFQERVPYVGVNGTWLKPEGVDRCSATAHHIGRCTIHAKPWRGRTC
jgi:hypothetical protein